MANDEQLDRLKSLTTAHVADACVRTDVPVRCAPAAVRAMVADSHIAGPARPARHVGSVDIFLEVIEEADAGDVLVVDNAGRLDEACVGDLVVLEAQRAGLAGLVIWGLHRDSADIDAIGLPVFSGGATPAGPQRLDERPADAVTSAQVGECRVTADDVVLGDEDGVLFVPYAVLPGVVEVAETIRDTERRQAAQMRDSTTLRDQVQFQTYLQRRREDPSYSFRRHLQVVKGAIEV